MSAHDNATPIRIIHNSAGHLNGPARSLGAILIGYLGKQTFTNIGSWIQVKYMLHVFANDSIRGKRSMHLKGLLIRGNWRQIFTASVI